MSYKALYQTLYQNDQLFRLDEEPTAVMAVPVPAVRLEEEITQVDETLVIAGPVDLPVARTVLPPEPVRVVIPDPMVVPAADVEKITAHSPSTTPKTMKPAPAAKHIDQKVLILVDEELTPGDYLFLEKILKAVHLNLEGTEVYNLQNSEPSEIKAMLQGKLIHHFFTFGVPFSQIHLDIMMDRYQPVRFEGITFMIADALPVIEADKDLKKRLWGALQRIFFFNS